MQRRQVAALGLAVEGVGGSFEVLALQGAEPHAPPPRSGGAGLDEPEHGGEGAPVDLAGAGEALHALRRRPAVLAGAPGVQQRADGGLAQGGRQADGRGLEEALERVLAERLDLRTDVMVRAAADWAAIVAANPFPGQAARDPGRLVVMALKEAPDSAALEELVGSIVGPERVHASGAQLYVTYPDGIGRSKLTGAAIEARLGIRGTARNWNTVLKLAELAKG